MSNFGFNGVDIQFRKSGTDWPRPYRVRVYTNKNERQECRTTVFCHTFDDAIKAALAQPITQAITQIPQPRSSNQPIACIYKGYLYMAHEFPSGIPANALRLVAPRLPLTDDEIEAACGHNPLNYNQGFSDGVRFAESTHL